MVHITRDPCLYHQWSKDKVVLIVSWIDDNIIIGFKKAIEKAKKVLMQRFDCKDCEDLEEYLGCKIEWTENSLKFTQLVLLQSYSDKFELPTRIYKTPAQVGSVLVAGKKIEALSPAMQKKHCSGTGKAMHAMQYLKPEMYNSQSQAAEESLNFNIIIQLRHGNMTF